MKKLLILLFVFVSFFVNAQELDEIYIRDAFYLADSGVIAITEGDTLATIEKVRSTINDSLSVFVGSQWADSTSGIVYAGGNVGIGTADPLSALHLNKGFGTGTGIGLGDGDSELYEVADDVTKMTVGNVDVALWAASGMQSLDNFPFATNQYDLGTTTRYWDNLYINDIYAVDDIGFFAGDKEIARASENVTEQFIINPQGDLTGTAAAPSLAFGDGNTGFYEISDNVLGIGNAGSLFWQMSTTVFGSTNTNRSVFLAESASNTNPNIVPQLGNLGTGIGGNDNEISLIANSIEGLRITGTAAHSVAGIANYETLVTADDDIPNKAYVDSVAISVSGFLHGNYTENEVFDAMVVDIPDVNDAMIVSGAFDGAITTINASRAVKTAFDEVTVYGFTEAGAVATYVFDDGDATARDISLAW